MRLAASAVVTLFLLGLCVVLAGPAFELDAIGRKGGLAAGALPQFVLVAMALLALASFGSDLASALRRGAAFQGGSGFEAGTGRVLVIGVSMLALLAAYVSLWRVIGFPAASALFMAAASFLVAPAEARRRAGLLTIGLTAVLFSVGVWLAFTEILAVPLR